eukprot:m.8075 g.8075  ORF g.8075 m.8075 type:complete len:995 (-) comp5317_c0_seq1:208-3192(-)
MAFGRYDIGMAYDMGQPQDEEELDVSVVPDVQPLFKQNRLHIGLLGHTISQMSVADGRLFLALGTEMILVKDVQSDASRAEQIALPAQKYRMTDVVFMSVDPTGSHVVFCAQTESGFDTFYIHVRARAPSTQRLRSFHGRRITALAWNPSAISRDSLSTQEILLGDNQGCVHSTTIEKSDKHTKQVFQVGTKPIQNIHIELHSSARYFAVIILTASTLHEFLGEVTQGEYNFAQALSSENLLGSRDFDQSPTPTSSFFHNTLEANYTVAWLGASGAYTGTIRLGFGINERSTFLPKFELVPLTDATEAQPSIFGLLLTRFHVMFLLEQSLVVYCTVNKKKVFDTNYPKSRVGAMLGFCRDDSTGEIYAYSEKAIYSIDASNETQNVWRQFCELGQYDDALDLCTTEDAKQEVRTAHADALFAEGNYGDAVRKYAQTDVSFETVCLKLMDKHQDMALIDYLKLKLRSLGQDQLTQRTMLATWLVEIYLSYLDRLKDAEDQTTYDSMFTKFQGFISSEDEKILDKDTVFDLISSHGNVEALLFFAEAKKDYVTIIQHHIHNDAPMEALQLLERHNKPELVYRFAPELIQVAPRKVLRLCRRMPNIEPRELIPAFTRHQQQHPGRNETTIEIVNYLQWCIDEKQVHDQVIHHYVLSLYSQIQPSPAQAGSGEEEADMDDRLMDFLIGQLQDPINCVIDKKYALRICSEANQHRACVAIYVSLGLYEEAIERALTFSRKLAIQVAKFDKDLKIQPDLAQASLVDEARIKYMWLQIAKHIITKDNDIEGAMNILAETDALSIEDILPFFQDFKIIDPFQEHIKASLGNYNTRIQDLERDMNMATTSARAIRADIVDINRRHEVVSGAMQCSTCSYPLLSRPFYLFPCHHGFHKDCLIQEMLPHIRPSTARRIRDLQDKLETTRSPKNIAKLSAELDDLAGSDCLRCGEFAIKMIEVAFVEKMNLPDYIRSWTVEGHGDGGRDGVVFGDADAPEDLETFI